MKTAVNTDPTPAELLRRIAKIRWMERCRVTVQEYKKRNGQISESYAIQVWDKEAKRTRTLPVPRHQKKAFDKAYQAYQKYRKLRDQYEDIVIWRTRAEIKRRCGG
jgi:hypothetical protein